MVFTPLLLLRDIIAFPAAPHGIGSLSCDSLFGNTHAKAGLKSLLVPFGKTLTAPSIERSWTGKPCRDSRVLIDEGL